MNSISPRILVVGGHLDSLISLKAELGVALPGCEVLTALNGAEGLDIALETDPDVILLDIAMPKTDGVDVCQRLKADERLKDTPVILLTAPGTDVDSRAAAPDPGVEAALSRPWSARELATQTRAMVKVRAVNRLRRVEKARLEDLVVEHARKLQKEQSERKRAEEALRYSNESWNNTFNAITDIILVLSREHDIIEINDAGCLALNRPKDQILGRKCFELIHGRNSPILGCPCVQAVAERKACMGEYEECGKCYSIVVWPTVRECGQLVSLAHVATDITPDKQAEAERQRMAEQLRVSQKMEAIGSLTGGIAHDFNNMLCAIMTFTDIALESIGGDDSRQGPLVEVKKASERAASLIRQLLAFSRKQILQPVLLDLNRVTTELQEMLRRILGEDIALVPMLAPDLGLTMADPSQIEQLLMNLVVNARDAMPTGGRLTIETANVELDEAFMLRGSTVRPGRYVLLAVTDTGVGMDARTRARIFEPFFTTKERDKGTGLGLSTVYGIVRQSEGEILVHSHPGQGTTFRIYLPRSEATAQDAPMISPSAKRTTGKETILVVEDESSVRDLAKQGLVRAGYTVLTATSGGEALRLCEQHTEKIHLTLTDVVMPGIGGRAFAQQLVQQRPGIKILYMSGHTEGAIDNHGPLDPDAHFITKPFSLTDLRRKVRDVLDEP